VTKSADQPSDGTGRGIIARRSEIVQVVRQVATCLSRARRTLDGRFGIVAAPQRGSHIDVDCSPQSHRLPCPPFEPPKNPYPQGFAGKAEEYSLQRAYNLNSAGRVETAEKSRRKALRRAGQRASDEVEVGATGFEPVNTRPIPPLGLHEPTCITSFAKSGARRSDDTEARNAARRCFGRSDRSAPPERPRSSSRPTRWAMISPKR
jgi:hypothetical protein